jgi:hypothetical protein
LLEWEGSVGEGGVLRRVCCFNVAGVDMLQLYFDGEALIVDY